MRLFQQEAPVSREYQTSLTPEQRTLRAQLAAHVSWSNTDDRAKRTAAARTAAMSRFEREVRARHPELSDVEVAVRADHAKKAFYLRLTLKSAQARAARKGARGGDTA